MNKLFLTGAGVVLDAVSDPRVAAAWHAPSVLADQTIGGLAAHLARGSVWVVEEYLERDVADDAPLTFGSAAGYYAEVSASLTDADHAAIRARGAELAEAGPREVTARLHDALERLRVRLPSEPPDRPIAVYGDAVMALDAYLGTRVVEQVVHLDDLARSLDIGAWSLPEPAEALAIACGAEIGRLRRGGTAMIRALFRDADPATLPVI